MQTLVAGIDVKVTVVETKRFTTKVRIDVLYNNSIIQTTHDHVLYDKESLTFKNIATVHINSAL